MLFVDIASVVVLARLLATVLARLGQPPVLAEILAGILLGSAVLGALPGNLTETLFPNDVRDSLTAIGGVGLVLFMFLVGLSFDVGALRRRQRVMTRVAAGSLGLPFGLGLGLAVLLYDAGAAPQGVPFAPFALFVATALSVTALPVLARIIADRGMTADPLAQLATGSAVIHDGVGWMMLTVSLAVLDASDVESFVLIALGTAAFAGVLLVAVPPVLRWGCRLAPTDASASGAGHGNGGELALRGAAVPAAAIVLAGVFASAGAAELLELHSAIGAFAFGAVVPRREGAALIRTLRSALEPVTMTVLLPVFFLIPGLTFSLSGVGGHGLPLLGLLLVLACAGKLVGAAVPARIEGLSWREATIVGVLLNTRGLVELVVVNVGLNEGVIDQGLFSDLVIMALVTTAMTGPLLGVLGARERSRVAA